MHLLFFPPAPCEIQFLKLYLNTVLMIPLSLHTLFVFFSLPLSKPCTVHVQLFGAVWGAGAFGFLKFLLLILLLALCFGREWGVSSFAFGIPQVLLLSESLWPAALSSVNHPYHFATPLVWWCHGERMRAFYNLMIFSILDNLCFGAVIFTSVSLEVWPQEG